ncbi:MAG TPA: bacillithiol biosynthesis deacetylase BshB1 [Bacteroidetes bacterium]|nr:bacillithiol biosynthesis deacetylase BshB1 [Bacteroidota bacterium]HRR07296.1 bacillithiol biosynthesis deacetylase BshB1 [Rhodothermales bacterium]
MKLDVLAFAAHPDDIELSCGGTVCLLVKQGYRVGVVDFTRGELGSRGTPELRALEAAEASRVMGIHARENLGIPDGHIENTPENRRKVIEVLRRYRPHLVLVNAPKDRHPDHPNAAVLSLEAIFYAGLRKIATHEKDGTEQAPWRPSHVLHYFQSVMEDMEPTLVVDVTEVWDQRVSAMQAFRSQFWSKSYNPATDEPETFISSPAFMEWLEARARTFGYRIGAKYAEPFLYHNGPIGVKNLMETLTAEKPY